MSKSITIDNTLDSNLKPLKIDNKLTGIELSDDSISIRNTTSIDKNLSLGGSIKFEKDDPNINFGNQLGLQIDTSAEQYTFYGTIMSLSGGLFSNHVDTDVKLLLQPDGTGDSTITFYEDNVSARFAIGHDATDTTFQIVSGTTMGTNTLLSMAQTGAKTFNCTDGNTDLKLTSSANVNDYCSITVGAEGATTIATVDADTAAANLTVDVDGDITLDSGTGEFIAKKSGTEFSVANSAYAGMIIGYTRIQNTGTGASDMSITMDGTMTVLQTVAGTNVGVTFVAPPSGNVEIVMSCCVYASSRTIAFALSDSTTHNEINQIYTYDSGVVASDETDRNLIDVTWAVTGLTSGTSYTYYISGMETVSGTSNIAHGTFRASGEHFPPIIVKAIALPATITTGS